jgi:hypothetical protein
MDKAIAFKWASALRASPELQTQDVLAEDGGYCALGILCKIYCDEVEDIAHKCENGLIDGFWDLSRDDPSRTAILLTAGMPLDVMVWAGMEGESCVLISDMNDGARVFSGTPRTFPQIADFIEDNHKTI